MQTNIFPHKPKTKVVTTLKTPFYVVASALLLSTSGLQAADAAFCKNAQDRDCFTGVFDLKDIPQDPTHKILAADFGYIDPLGKGWQTDKGAKTDGASIPKLLQPFVGSPWEKNYIRAAVIHDWYCDRHVRPWKETHKVFYSAMLASGLESRKAKLMFYAVYAFGPKWGYLIDGKPCTGTNNCINATNTFTQIPGRLNEVSNTAELKAIESIIDATENKGGLSLDELMAAADKAHPTQPMLDKLPSSEAER